MPVSRRPRSSDLPRIHPLLTAGFGGLRLGTKRPQRGTVRDGEGVHVLAYYMDLEDQPFLAELRRLREDRFSRGERMVAKLQDLGYPITFDRVREIAKGGTIVRPHVARALVEAGVVPTVKEAFTDQFIGDGSPAYVEKQAMRPREALGLIHAAGGVCVLAHPGTWRETDPVPDSL